MLHERNVILTIRTGDLPLIADDDKLKFEKVDDLFSRLVITFGYMETPNVPRALTLAAKFGLTFEPMRTSFFLSRRNVLEARKSKMPRWQDKLFIGLARNANDASRYFQLPTDRVVELGTQFSI